jgi:exosome complex component RRP43
MLTHVCSEHLLPDPTAFETPLLDTTITIALDSEDAGSSTQASGPKIRLVRQNGLGGLGGKQSTTGMALLGNCLGVAKARVKAMSEVLYSV